jgi:hypothetical protein
MGLQDGANNKKHNKQQCVGSKSLRWCFQKKMPAVCHHRSSKFFSNCNNTVYQTAVAQSLRHGNGMAMAWQWHGNGMAMARQWHGSGSGQRRM